MPLTSTKRLTVSATVAFAREGHSVVLGGWHGDVIGLYAGLHKMSIGEAIAIREMGGKQ